MELRGQSAAFTIGSTRITRLDPCTLPCGTHSAHWIVESDDDLRHLGGQLHIIPWADMRTETGVPNNKTNDGTIRGGVAAQDVRGEEGVRQAGGVRDGELPERPPSRIQGQDDAKPEPEPTGVPVPDMRMVAYNGRPAVQQEQQAEDDTAPAGETTVPGTG